MDRWTVEHRRWGGPVLVSRKKLGRRAALMLRREIVARRLEYGWGRGDHAFGNSCFKGQTPSCLTGAHKPCPYLMEHLGCSVSQKTESELKEELAEIEMEVALRG